MVEDILVMFHLVNTVVAAFSSQLDTYLFLHEVIADQFTVLLTDTGQPVVHGLLLIIFIGN